MTVTDSLGCTSTDSIYVSIEVCGCTGPTVNYNESVTLDDGSCIPYIYGSHDSTAIFYDSTANTDDGSCIYCDISFTQFVFKPKYSW